MEVKKNKCFDVIYSATTKCGSHSPPHAIRATGWLLVALVAHRNLSIDFSTYSHYNMPPQQKLQGRPSLPVGIPRELKPKI
jgi:hypothetical protein